MTVGDRIAQALQAAGIEIVFGLDDPQALFAGLRTIGVRPIIVHDERSGAFMADGYARASHRLAVCTGISGPGATNLATGLLEAYCASTPILAIVGEATPKRADTHAFQQAPHASVIGPLTKAVVRLDRGSDPENAVAHAINRAVSGRPRPVLLLAPDDHLWDESEPDDMPSSTTPGIDYPQSRSIPPASDIDQALQALRGARRPVLLAGGGVNVSQAGPDLLEFAERQEIPVALTVMGKGALPETHRLALGVASSYTSGATGRGALATRALCEADLIFAVGTDLDVLTTSGGLWPSPEARLVRVDIDPDEMTNHAGIHLHGDARETLRRLNERARETIATSTHDMNWVRQLIDESVAKRAKIDRDDASREPADPINPGRLVRELERHLSEGDAIVTDASYSSAWVLDRACQSWTGRFVLAARGSGVLGWGLPASLGVKLARPRSHVVCVTGDGGLCFSLGELETAVRQELAVTVILLNNRSFGFQRHSDIARQGTDPGDLSFGESTDYAALAQAAGWSSATVRTYDEFTEAAATAISLEEPYFIDVLIEPDEIPPLRAFDGLRDQLLTET